MYLKAHTKSQTCEGPDIYTICDGLFSLAGNNAHETSRWRDTVLYSCTICDKLFSLAKNLKTYLRIYIGKRPYSCAICDKSFS